MSEEKLDQFRPSPEVMLGVRRQLTDAGIEPESIPGGWLEAIIAGTAKWIKTREEGASYIADLLEFDWRRGEDGKYYLFLDDQNNQVHDIDSQDVMFMQGVRVKGWAVPLRQVELADKPDESCDGCGVNAHCTKTLTGDTRQLETLCNYCMVHSESPLVYEQGDRDGCDNCSKLVCSNNPHKEKIRAIR